MGYAMKSENEALRLEKQAQQPGYRLDEELASVSLPERGKFLDAGCGSGLLSRYLQAQSPLREITGVDASDLRLHQARQEARQRGFNQISFERGDLNALPYPTDSFDVVLCRYVFEHLPNPAAVMAELVRVLKPGGRLVLINYDGIVVNMHSRDEELQRQLAQLSAGYTGDLYIARKLPALMGQAGLHSLGWTSYCTDFRAEARGVEAANTRDRFEFAQQELLRIFGSSDIVEDFKSRYFRALEQTSTTLFYTKFVVEGRK